LAPAASACDARVSVSGCVGAVAGDFADVVAEGVEFGGDLCVEVGDLAFVGGEEGGGHGVEWGIN